MLRRLIVQSRAYGLRAANQSDSSIVWRRVRIRLTAPLEGFAWGPESTHGLDLAALQFEIYNQRVQLLG